MDVGFGGVAQEISEGGEDGVLDEGEGAVFVRVERNGRVVGLFGGGVKPGGAAAVGGEDGDAVFVAEGEVGIDEEEELGDGGRQEGEVVGWGGEGGPGLGVGVEDEDKEGGGRDGGGGGCRGGVGDDSVH